MKDFLNISHEFSGINKGVEVLKDNGTVHFTGLSGVQVAHISESVRQRTGAEAHVIIVSDEQKAVTMTGDMAFMGINAVYYPAKDAIFYNVGMHGNEIMYKRLGCISRYIECTENNEPITVVTTADACLDMLIPIEKYKKSIKYIYANDETDTDRLAEELVKMGYERRSIVNEAGQFAIRGGIIDIFDVTSDTPVRIELWGDSVESIRTFNAETQKSISETDMLRIFPATDMLFSDEEIRDAAGYILSDIAVRLDELGDNNTKKDAVIYERCNRLRALSAVAESNSPNPKFISYYENNISYLLDYFGDNTLISVVEPMLITERFEELNSEYMSSMESRYAEGYCLESQTHGLKNILDMYKSLKSRKCCIFTSFDSRIRDIESDCTINIRAVSSENYNNAFDLLIKELKSYQKRNYRICLVTSSTARKERLIKELSDNEIRAYNSSDYGELVPGTTAVMLGGLSEGFEYPENKFVCISENDIFKDKKRKKQKRKHIDITELDMVPGDFVVHESHGIGIYRGIERIKTDNVYKDYVKIEYAGNSAVYVLATQADVLQKYANADTDKKPTVNKLGSVAWSNAKRRAKESAEKTAKDLIEIYARRMQLKGYRFSEDDEWQREFEELFPYEETDDQLAAVEDIKSDMESDRIMDRLICGDVGFGKTEVAMRAAFKAVNDGKQVAFLAPTTILARQQYLSFVNRFSSFPVKISHMSGFCTAAENRAVAKDVAAGNTDIVIGTHRILSKDMVFKDLGLLIIDEEQRFGVAHKEKLKKLKANVDVLALSATPIPRTLNMSLAGIRDMSTLEEPPIDRMPIQTFVTEHNMQIVKEAITREVARGGQVYYVNNRVQGIENVTRELEEMMPDVTFAYAHGQMDKKQLERVMLSFTEGETDVLVSTTIVETGMDIANVNTIIIEDADKFGLSQLYQLRGRVGRSGRSSYSFLLYRRDRAITETALKRLNALRELTDLGSGYKIAMKDLEIRGAGNLLGKTQHGFISSVGFEMYTKLINNAVAELKGEPVKENEYETTVDLNVDAYVPNDYITKETQKLEIYKRISNINSHEDVSDMLDELNDRYGAVPKETVNLLNIAYIKSLAHGKFITEIRGGKKNGKWTTAAYLYRDAPVGFQNEIKSFCEKAGGSVLFIEGEDKCLMWSYPTAKVNNTGEYLDLIVKTLVKLNV